MVPARRAYVNGDALRLDILPLLTRIIVPALRPVSLHLYTQQERENLNHVVSVMIDYNLTYVQERTPEGTYVYNMGKYLFWAYYWLQQISHHHHYHHYQLPLKVHCWT